VAYFNEKLNKAWQNYSTYDLESFMVFFGYMEQIQNQIIDLIDDSNQPRVSDDATAYAKNLKDAQEVRQRLEKVNHHHKAAAVSIGGIRSIKWVIVSWFSFEKRSLKQVPITS